MQLAEYQQARQDLGDTLSTRLYYMMVENPWQNIYETLLTNFPTVSLSLRFRRELRLHVPWLTAA
jgi:hypothetical protein